MQARLLARNALGAHDLAAARNDVEAAKVALGEAGPVWWDDDTEDVSGRHPDATSYKDWWRALSPDARLKGDA